MRLRVVQVPQHRRVPRRRDQHVLEAAERVAADHDPVVVVAVVPHVVAGVRDVEQVRPEVDHHLEQLALAPARPRDRRRSELEHQVPREVLEILVHPRDRPLQAREEPVHELLARAVVDRRWVELLVEPRGPPLRADPLERARRRAEGRSPQQVQVRVARHVRRVRRPGRRRGEDAAGERRPRGAPDGRGPQERAPRHHPRPVACVDLIPPVVAFRDRRRIPHGTRYRSGGGVNLRNG